MMVSLVDGRARVPPLDPEEMSGADGHEPGTRAAAGKRVVFLSGYHDYRTAKRASIHQIAESLVGLGFAVSFISTRFSAVSKLTGDSRLFLWKRANSIEMIDGVRCLLWRTLLHPFSTRNRLVQAISGTAFDAYAELPNRAFDNLISEADYVIVESGVGAIYLRRIRRQNPDASVIYYAADRLATIHAHPAIQRRLAEDESLIDYFLLRASQMKSDFPFAAGRLYKSGFGIDADEYAKAGPNPYAAGEKVAISVGSMLFDPAVFQSAAPKFPEVEFHIIGAGVQFATPANVHLHPEMPFDRTLAFVKHATIGIAPYAPAPGADYLAESSLKLAQFEHFGLPSVCPQFAAGGSPYRVGYEPGDEASIGSAVAKALSMAGSLEPRSFPSWEEIACQVIDPRRNGASRID